MLFQFVPGPLHIDIHSRLGSKLPADPVIRSGTCLEVLAVPSVVRQTDGHLFRTAIQDCVSAGDFFQDVYGLGGPDEGFGVLIVAVDVVADGHDELFGVLEDAAPQPVFGQIANLWRRLVLPKGIETWSLTSLQQRLVKTGGRLVKHARYYWLLLAESHLTRRLFGSILRQILALPLPAG